LQTLHPALGRIVRLEPTLVQPGDGALDILIKNGTAAIDVVLDVLMGLLQPLECFDSQAQEVLAIATFHRFLVILEKLLGTVASYGSLRPPESPEFSAIQVNFAFRGPKGYDSHVTNLRKVVANPLVPQECLLGFMVIDNSSAVLKS
jgi:hypothetical protein